MRRFETSSFQSPSLRGSGRFMFSPRRAARLSACFNPLHCGAVVASGADLAEVRVDIVFQSPSLRGSGRFRGRRPRGPSPLPFQSPSLRGSGRFEVPPMLWHGGGVCFNPLHCGAVVASPGRRKSAPARKRVSIPFIAGQWSLHLAEVRVDIGGAGCFNPLHCGAVVASAGGSWWLTKDVLHVSIPFIAGQWSLRDNDDFHHVVVLLVSIPFIAGQWSLLHVVYTVDEVWLLVSIPFIAGQWSLRI